MENPFVALKKADESTANSHPEGGRERVLAQEEEKSQKKNTFYTTYSPMVEEVLDMLIAAYRPGVWKKGSDFSHAYCCHISWFAGPEETHHASYDDHHEIRRCIEVFLEQDLSCNPFGFKILNYEKVKKCNRVGLSREELIQGIKEVLG